MFNVRKEESDANAPLRKREETAKREFEGDHRKKISEETHLHRRKEERRDRTFIGDVSKRKEYGDDHQKKEADRTFIIEDGNETNAPIQ